jgi:hypothetical protein
MHATAIMLNRRGYAKELATTLSYRSQGMQSATAAFHPLFKDPSINLSRPSSVDNPNASKKHIVDVLGVCGFASMVQKQGQNHESIRIG